MPSIGFFNRKQPDYPLPSSIARSFIQSSSGSLELLIAEPKDTAAPRKQPLFLAHGGCGGAAVWLEWMNYFSQKHNIPCYAVSYRGHGSSWYPGYLRMYFTPRRSFANDLVAGIKYAQETESKKRGGEDVKVVLVGHSAGGGLSQVILNAGNVQVRGLVLLDAIPIFGGLEVNQNWFRMDPWMIVRMLFKHLGHPMSPLSSSFLVKQAFFCPSYPDSKVIDFEKRMPRHESYMWPLANFSRLATAANVIKSIVGWGSNDSVDRIAVVTGSLDRICTPDLMRRTADEYRAGYARAIEKGEVEAKSTVVEGEVTNSSGLGTVYYEVEGAGHHLQNDLQWEDGAEKVVEFFSRL